MTDYLSIIKKPIESELGQFISLFNSSLTHEDKLQEEIFARIRNRAGKRMRPMLIMLMARNYGAVNDATLHAAVGLELLHTASLVHDDVVDESRERRGQASVNALYDNKVAVLVGDYILSTALLHVSITHNELIVRYLAELGARFPTVRYSSLRVSERAKFPKRHTTKSSVARPPRCSRRAAR